MADQADTHYAAADDSLERRTRGRSGITREQAVARGQRVLGQQAADYRAKLRADLDALAAAIAGDAAGSRGADRGAGDPGAVAAGAMEIKSLAGTFGWELVGRAATSLYRYLRYVPATDGKRGEVLRSHLDALRYLVDREVPASDRAATRMVEELEKAVAHRRAGTSGTAG